MPWQLIHSPKLMDIPSGSPQSKLQTGGPCSKQNLRSVTKSPYQAGSWVGLLSSFHLEAILEVEKRSNQSKFQQQVQLAVPVPSTRCLLGPLAASHGFQRTILPRCACPQGHVLQRDNSGGWGGKDDCEAVDELAPQVIRTSVRWLPKFRCLPWLRPERLSCPHRTESRRMFRGAPRATVNGGRFIIPGPHS